LRKTKDSLKEEIGLQFINNGQLVAAYTDVEKHIQFMLRQPGIQGTLQFPNNIMVMYDNLDEFRCLNWSASCSGESIQLKLVEFGT